MKRRIWVEIFVVLGMIMTGCGRVTLTPTAQVQNPIPSLSCTVPDMVGLDEVVAMDMIMGLGLQPNKSVQHDAVITNGAVISQNPSGGTLLEPCEGRVGIVVSLGPIPKPTEPPTPTATPGPPTSTPTLTPLPPTATPTPDPRLFWDDFEGLPKT